MQIRQPNRKHTTKDRAALTGRRAVVLVMLLLLLFAWVAMALAVPDDSLAEDDVAPVLDGLVLAGCILALSLMAPGLTSRLSVFARVVVYLGGRFKTRRFHDRLLDTVAFPHFARSKTAPFRAVFAFLGHTLPV